MMRSLVITVGHCEGRLLVQAGVVYFRNNCAAMTGVLEQGCCIPFQIEDGFGELAYHCVYVGSEVLCTNAGGNKVIR